MVLIPRTIWAFWDGPKNELVDLCIDSWRSLNPEYTVTLLDMNSVKQHLPDFSPVHKESMQKYTDFLRLAILAKHGGVWVDATLLCIQPLNEWIGTRSFCGFRIEYVADPGPNAFPVLENWFIASAPTGFMRRWRDTFFQIETGDVMANVEEWERRGVKRQGISVPYLAMHFAAQVVLQLKSFSWERVDMTLYDAKKTAFRYLVDVGPDASGAWDSRGAIEALTKTDSVPGTYVIKFRGAERDIITNDKSLHGTVLEKLRSFVLAAHRRSDSGRHERAKAVSVSTRPPQIDFSSIPIRAITLKPEEFTEVNEALAKAGFKNPVTRFSGIRGADQKAALMTDRSILTLRSLYDIEFAKTRESHAAMPSWGGVGCYLSHEALWREAGKGNTGIIIVEADARPQKNAAEYAERDLINTEAFLGHRPDLLWFASLVSPDQKQEIGLSDVRRAGRVLGAHAYFISPVGARALLSLSRPIEVQVDSYMGYATEILALDSFVSVNSLFSQVNKTGTSIQLKRVEDIMAHDSSPQTNNASLAFVAAIIVVLVFMCAFLLMILTRESRAV